MVVLISDPDSRGSVPGRESLRVRDRNDAVLAAEEHEGPVGDGAYRWSFDFSRYACRAYPERFSFLARVHPFGAIFAREQVIRLVKPHLRPSSPR